MSSFLTGGKRTPSALWPRRASGQAKRCPGGLQCAKIRISEWKAKYNSSFPGGVYPRQAEGEAKDSDFQQTKVLRQLDECARGRLLFRAGNTATRQPARIFNISCFWPENFVSLPLQRGRPRRVSLFFRTLRNTSEQKGRSRRQKYLTCISNSTYSSLKSITCIFSATFSRPKIPARNVAEG